MSFQRKVKQSFGRVKEDIEGVKNELAFALKRIAKIEEMLTKQEVERTSSKKFGSKSKKR